MPLHSTYKSLRQDAKSVTFSITDKATDRSNLHEDTFLSFLGIWVHCDNEIMGNQFQGVVSLWSKSSHHGRIWKENGAGGSQGIYGPKELPPLTDTFQ